MEQVDDHTGTHDLAGKTNLSAQIGDSLLPQRSVQPAVPGDLSAPEDERMDHESAAAVTAAADCIWNYAALRTLDFALMPSAPVFRRFGGRRFHGSLAI